MNNTSTTLEIWQKTMLHTIHARFVLLKWFHPSREFGIFARWVRVKHGRSADDVSPAYAAILHCPLYESSFWTSTEVYETSQNHKNCRRSLRVRQGGSIDRRRHHKLISSSCLCVRWGSSPSVCLFVCWTAAMFAAVRRQTLRQTDFIVSTPWPRLHGSRHVTSAWRIHRGGRLGRKIFLNVSENKSRDRKLSISYSILVVRLLCWMAISKVSRTFWPSKSELVSTASHWNILAGLDDFACVILDSRGCTLCTNFYIFGIRENALTITQAQREPAPPLGAQPPDPFPPMHDLLNPPLHAGSFRHRLHCNRLDIKFRPRCCPLVGQFAYSSPCWVTLAFFTWPIFLATVCVQTRRHP